MQLECEDGRIYQDPTPEEIEGVLRQLGQRGTAFVVLSRSRQAFIQSGADARQRCDLEYREGSGAAHYHCTNDTLPVDEVIAAFQAYAAGSEAWKERFRWVRLEA